MKRDLESILRKGGRKLPKVCRFAEEYNSISPFVLFRQQQSRRALAEETAPTKAARSRNSGSSEALRGTSLVSVCCSSVTGRRDAESLLRSRGEASSR